MARHRGVGLSGSRSPYLPFELDLDAGDGCVIAALWHDNAHQVGIDALIDPRLPAGQTDLAGGKYNIAEKYIKDLSDITTSSSYAPYGGRVEARVRWPGWPRRGVGNTPTEYAVDGWRTHAGFAVDSRIAANCGVTVQATEPLGLGSTNQQWNTYFYAHAGAGLGGGRTKIMVQIDCASLNASNPTTWAQAIAPVLISEGANVFKTNGNIPISTFDPKILGTAWFTTFFSVLATNGVPNAYLVPLPNNSWSTSDTTNWLPFMQRVAGQTSWASSWDRTTPYGSPSSVSVTMRNAISPGGHHILWPVRPGLFFNHGGWFGECDGFKLLVSQYMDAINNKKPGDGIYMITWNDLYEGAECCPCDGVQYAIYDMCTFFNQWFRTGIQPRIVRDCMYYIHRVHAWDAKPNMTYQTFHGQFSDSFNRFGARYASNYAPVNRVQLALFLTETADVQIITSEGMTPHNNVPAGFSLVDAPLPVTSGGQPRFIVSRNGRTIMDMTSEFPVHPGTTVPYWQDLQNRAGGWLRYKLGQMGHLADPWSEPVSPIRSHLKGVIRYG